MFLLVVQGAFAAGEVVSNAPPVLPVARDVTNDTAAAWRNPFWPVGYLPPPDPARAAAPDLTAAIAAPQSRWQQARKQLMIQGLTRSQAPGDGHPHYLAVINGRMVETGDRVSVELDGVRYRWLVQSITAQGVNLEKVDALVVPVAGTR
ncbi:MAG: hypothetical protein WCL16_14215 [bacterium]